MAGSASSVFIVDRDLCYTSFSATHAADMKALYGADIELGRRPIDYQTVDADRETAEVDLRRALAGENHRAVGLVGDEAYGRRCIEVALEPVRDRVGDIAGVLVRGWDVTERQRAETDLALLSAAIENASVSIMIVDAEARIVRVNRRFAALLARTSGELTAMTLADLDARFAIPDWPAYLQRLRDAGGAAILRVTRRAADDSDVPLELQLSLAQVGEAELVVVFGIEIGDRLRAEQALAERERMLSTLMGNLPGMAYRCANDDVWTDEFVSAGAAQLLGYTAEAKMSGSAPSLSEQIHPDDRERVARETEAAVARDEPWQYTYRIVTADGRVKWVWERGVGVRDDGGEVVALEGFLHDVTAEHEAEERLTAAAAEWRRTFDAMRDSVAVLDRDGVVVRCNAATKDLTGRDFADLIGRRCYEVFHESACPVPECPHQRSLRSGRAEESVLLQAGRWIRVAFEPELDACGSVTGGVHVVSDVTELKLAEGRLRETVAQLQAITEGVIATIARTVEVRDPYTAGHQRRVSQLGEAIARRMGLDEERVQAVRVAGMVHDVGKIDIPAEILAKPGKLTEVEFELIRQHPLAGCDVLAGIDFPWPVAEITLQHHERLDGSGYPQGLAGDETLPEARVVAVADVVEAMASHRPYRPALGVEAALKEIAANSGRLYDPAACAACLALFREDGFMFDREDG